MHTRCYCNQWILVIIYMLQTRTRCVIVISGYYLHYMMFSCTCCDQSLLVTIQEVDMHRLCYCNQWILVIIHNVLMHMMLCRCDQRILVSMYDVDMHILCHRDQWILVTIYDMLSLDIVSILTKCDRASVWWLVCFLNVIGHVVVIGYSLCRVYSLESSLERMAERLHPKRMSMWSHHRVSQREAGIAPTASQLVIPCIR